MVQNRSTYSPPDFLFVRRNWFRTIAVFLALSFIQGASFAQNKEEANDLYYDVLKNNTVIGQIHAMKKIYAQATEYIIESNVNLEMLVVDFKIYSLIKAAFSGGQLKQSSLVRKVNGKEKVNMKINWASDRYLLQEESTVKTIHEKIIYTTACLMNAEPANLAKIFSENLQQFIAIKMIKPHLYELYLPDGNHHTYYYENGVCVWAKVNTSLSEATFRLKR